MYIISRSINGITLNGQKEYALNQADQIMKFETILEAKQYLAKQGYTEADMEAEGVEIELETEQEKENV